MSDTRDITPAQSRAALEFQRPAEGDREAPDMTALMRIAVEKGEDGVAALERLVAMRERAEDRAAERAYAAAFARVQAEMEPITTNKYNNQTKSRYANLEALYKELVPVYTRHGFALSFDEGDSPREGWIRILCDVMHEAGHSKPKHIDLPLDDRGMAGKANKTQLHATGSTLSYGRRYLALLAFNVATFDDDGNAGGGAVPDDTPITEKQAAALRDMAAEIATYDEAKFLGWIAKMAQVDKLERLGEIPARVYDHVFRELDQRRRREPDEGGES